MGRKASRSRSPAKASAAKSERAPATPKKTRRAASPGPAPRKSPRIARKADPASVTAEEEFLSLPMDGKLTKAKKVAPVPILGDIVASFVFLSTVALGGQWVRFLENFVPVSNFALFKTPLLLSWVFVTCVLCCMYLPVGSFNPWSVIDSKLPLRGKCIRMAAQTFTAVVFAFIVSLADAFLDTKFDRAFLGSYPQRRPLTTRINCTRGCTLAEFNRHTYFLSSIAPFGQQTWP